MEFRLRPLDFMEFFLQNNHQAVNEMNRKNTVKNHWDFVGIPTAFDCIFSIFDSFHFVNCLMIVVL